MVELERAAAGGDVDLVEQLQRVDRRPHDEEQRRRAEQRQARCCETCANRLAPSISAASSSSGRDALQRGQVDDHVEPEPPPHGHRHDAVHRLVGILEELLLRQADLVQQVVDQPEGRVEQPQEDDPGGHRRGDQRDEHGEPVEPDPADLAVQRDRHAQRADHRDRHEHDRVDERVADRRAELRVLGQRPVVGQADVVARGRSGCWPGSESSSDQPIGISANTAISTTAGATNAQPATCSEPTSRLRRRSLRWVVRVRCAQRGHRLAGALARGREDAVHLIGRVRQRLLRLRLAEQHRLDRLADGRRDLRIRWS